MFQFRESKGDIVYNTQYSKLNNDMHVYTITSSWKSHVNNTCECNRNRDHCLQLYRV